MCPDLTENHLINSLCSTQGFIHFFFNVFCLCYFGFFPWYCSFLTFIFQQIYRSNNLIYRSIDFTWHQHENFGQGQKGEGFLERRVADFGKVGRCGAPLLFTQVISVAVNKKWLQKNDIILSVLFATLSHRKQ